MTCKRSWNEEIDKTLAKAGVTFESVPVFPAMKTINWLDGKRQIYKTYMNYLYVVGFDKNGKATTHLVDRDTWK